MRICLGDKIVLKDNTVGFVYGMSNKEIQVAPIGTSAPVWVSRSDVLKVNPPVLAFG